MAEKTFKEPEYEIICLNETDVIAASSVDDFLQVGNPETPSNPGGGFFGK